MASRATVPDLSAITLAALDALPNPVLIKDVETRYVWVNSSFERLFGVDRATVVGELDAALFPDRQAAQCNGGDLRVLETGEVDEAAETVFDPDLGPRRVVTRKARIEVDVGSFLVGVLHDVTDVTEKNEQLLEASAQLQVQAVELERLAATDSLTGCLNRRSLTHKLDELVAAGGSVGIVSLDIDHFKAINDQYGHAAGDAVLSLFAETARSNIREGDVIARVGGEEFIVVLPGAGVEQANASGELIRAAISETPLEFEGNEISFTVSAGVAQYSESADGTRAVVAELLRAADARLYEAKNAGRNAVSAA